jgi:hypothetical protein
LEEFRIVWGTVGEQLLPNEVDFARKKRLRRRLLAKAVAARRAGKGACVPPGTAKNAAPGCTPAALPEPSSDLNQGDILIEVNQGTF